MARDMERFRRTSSRRFVTGTGVRLQIDNQTGSIVVQGGSGDEVVVDVVAEVWAESAQDADLELERIERSMTHSDGLLRIQTPELLRPSGSLLDRALSRAPKVDYEIRVPASSSVDLESRNSRIDVRGVRGPVKVLGQNGSVTLQQIVEAVAVESRNGAVRVKKAGAGVSVTSKNGSITIEEARGPVVGQANNGGIEIVNTGGPVRAQTRNGSVRYRGPVSGPIEIETRNGSIRLGVPRESRFELDASSARGSVRSDLPVRKSGSAGEATRYLVRLRSENGSIRLEEIAGAAGLPLD